MFWRRSKPPPIPKPTEMVLDVGGRAIPLLIRTNRQARQLILRIDPKREGAVLTLPRGVSRAEGLAMARERGDWLIAQLTRRPQKIAFADGAELPYQGRTVRIRHAPEGRGAARLEDDTLHVAGRPEYLARRTADWLKAEARRRIAGRVRAYAEILGVRPGTITLRDTHSRWGSCAHDRDLSFSWRLILAPPHVLDYVVAHEVAHLADMDHGERFWSRVASLVPGYAEAKIWLRRYGESLHRYG